MNIPESNEHIKNCFRIRLNKSGHNAHIYEFWMTAQYDVYNYSLAIDRVGDLRIRMLNKL